MKTMALLGLAAITQAAAPRVKPVDFDRFEVRDWGALGSGCRGGGAGPGNITVQMFHDLTASHRYRFVIATGDYGLDSRRPPAPQLQSFARECAIRFAIYPKPGFRLADLAAQTAFTIEKQKGVELRMQSVLSFGAHAFEPWVQIFPRSQAGRWEKAAAHASTLADDKEMKALACEEPFLFGLDLSMAAFGSDPGAAFQSSLKHHQAEIILELNECQKRNQL